jgi:hypothetical protein
MASRARSFQYSAEPPGQRLSDLGTFVASESGVAEAEMASVAAFSRGAVSVEKSLCYRTELELVKRVHWQALFSLY